MSTKTILENQEIYSNWEETKSVQPTLAQFLHEI